ncbi:MAG: hypothetical protein HFE46_06850 [Clostridia bacterium]|nr:hypothetical protein [Clostridia bacterium]
MTATQQNSVTNNANIENKYGRWAVTDEQAAKIAAKDAQAMAQFYNDNYKRIKSKAFRYLREHAPYYCMPSRGRAPHRYDIDDMLQQAYVDLPYIDYRSAYTIGLSFYRIFDRVDVGGLTTSTEPRTLGLCFLDNPIDEEGNAHMLDFIASTAGILPQSAEDTYLLTLEETTVQEYLSQHTIRDILRDALTADNEYAVMMYEIFTNWTDYEISDFLHLSKWDTVEKIRNRAGRTLAGQYHKILDKLREINSPYYDRFWASLPRQEENKRAAMCAFSFRRSNVGTAAVSP